MIKLLIGGSPCTYWSIAQTANRETEASGIGWELFRNYLIAKEKWKPDYFLYENNKSAAKAIKEQIKKELGVTDQLSLFEQDNGVRYTEINSALVSAQNRQRFYVTNFGDIEQPEDRGILLKDVLDSAVTWLDKSYTLDAHYDKTAGTYNPKKQHSYSRHMAAVPICADGEKGKTITASYYKYAPSDSFKKANPRMGIAEPVCVAQRGRYADNPKLRIAGLPTEQMFEAREDFKTNTLTTVQKDNMVAEPTNDIDGKTYQVYKVVDGKITIKDKQYPIKLKDGYYIIRKLTVSECMRLQTVPEWYVFPVSNSQAYKMLGNGWTVEVIKHLLSHIPNILSEEIEVLSMYDGMSCGQIALREMGCNVVKYTAYEIDKYAIQTTQYNFPDTIQMGDAFQVREDGWTV